MRIVINVIVSCLLKKAMAWQRTYWSLNLTRTERTCEKKKIKRVILSFPLSCRLVYNFIISFFPLLIYIDAANFPAVSLRRAGQ